MSSPANPYAIIRDSGAAGHAEPARLPRFIGVGPVRTGTTWLDAVFRGHLALPKELKETQFFGWRYDRGIEWYARFFREAPSHLIIGEFGPTYFFDRMARERIAQHLPGCKIICTLREPVARIYSHYQLWRKLAILKHSFEYEIEHNPLLRERLAYAPHLGEWLRIFKGRILVLIYEDSRRDRQAYVDQLCSFIGAPRLDLRKVPHEGRAVAHVERAPRSHRLARRARELKDFLEVHRSLKLRNALEPALEWCMGGGERFPPLEIELERSLRKQVAPDIAELEEILQRDLSIWKAPAAERIAAAS